MGKCMVRGTHRVGRMGVNRIGMYMVKSWYEVDIRMVLAKVVVFMGVNRVGMAMDAVYTVGI